MFDIAELITHNLINMNSHLKLKSKRNEDSNNTFLGDKIIVIVKKKNGGSRFKDEGKPDRPQIVTWKVQHKT